MGTKPRAPAGLGGRGRPNGLRELRKNALMTQQELAAALGVDQKRISQWENGEVRPRPANLRRLCDALKVTPRELLDALEEVEGKAAA